MRNPNIVTFRGAVVALFTGGAFFGAGFASPTADYLGRRWTIVIGSIIFALGGALQTGAPTIKYLQAGRFLAGLGVGFLTMIIPLYQAEIAHPSIRGMSISEVAKDSLTCLKRNGYRPSTIHAWNWCIDSIVGRLGNLQHLH